MIGRVWVRLRLWVVSPGLVDYLKALSIKLHQDARNEPDPVKSMDLRIKADDCEEDAENIKHRLQGDE